MEIGGTFFGGTPGAENLEGTFRVIFCKVSRGNFRDTPARKTCGIFAGINSGISRREFSTKFLPPWKTPTYSSPAGGSGGASPKKHAFFPEGWYFTKFSEWGGYLLDGFWDVREVQFSGGSPHGFFPVITRDFGRCDFSWSFSHGFLRNLARKVWRALTRVNLSSLAMNLTS